VRAPVAIIRGAWDGLIPDEDARWLFDALSSPSKRDIKISRGTHLMHLEVMRHALHRESIAFLMGDEASATPAGALSYRPAQQQVGEKAMDASTEKQRMPGYDLD
jgi:hypothetical protein